MADQKRGERRARVLCPPYAVEYRPGQLLREIRHRDSKAYIRATVETLALLNYLRLCADSLEKGETS